MIDKKCCINFNEWWLFWTSINVIQEWKTIIDEYADTYKEAVKTLIEKCWCDECSSDNCIFGLIDNNKL